VADVGEKIGPVVEALLEPGEQLEGMCIGSRSGLMSSKFVDHELERRLSLA
jgi:hypothetical protein